MEWVLFAIISIFVAKETGVLDKPEPEFKPVVEVITGPQYIVEEKPTYKPDHYYKDESGDYYITDLSTPRVQTVQTEQPQ